MHIGFGAIVRAVRVRQGLSARRLSIEAGLSESYVGKLEHEQVEPSLKVFAKIVTALGFTNAEILHVIRSEAANEIVTPPA